MAIALRGLLTGVKDAGDFAMTRAVKTGEPESGLTRKSVGSAQV